MTSTPGSGKKKNGKTPGKFLTIQGIVSRNKMGFDDSIL
jgi:hypothetical protein